MKLVIDASVAVKWILPEPAREANAERALDVLRALGRGDAAAIQPPHWLAEVVAVLARLRPAAAAKAVDLLDAMEFPVAADAAVYKRASDLAARLGQHVFDTLYHAVALEHDATLVTADARYLRKAAPLGRIVALADWSLAR
ncbi:MAG: type II toxin-antitoxin system VapC family toxin [Burkholderiales bacterium]|nr:type II toxin-antitoxin system VapC family toxin [Burkholderiales bacterium]